MTPDPAGLGAATLGDPQSLNRYAYVRNDPISLIDWFGLCDEPMTYDAKTDTFICIGHQPLIDLGPQGGGAPVPIDPYPIQPIPNDIEPNRKGAKQPLLCATLPVGRTFGVTYGLGGIGGVSGSVEVVINYNSGQVSIFGSGGLAAGWQGGAQTSAVTGYIWGHLKDDNSGYSGGFSTVYGSALLGAYHSESSGGITGTFGDMVPNGNVKVTGISVGASLVPFPTGGVTVTNYTNPGELPPWLSAIVALLNPQDLTMIALRKACPK